VRHGGRGGAHPFMGLWRGGEATVRGGDKVVASMPAISARGEETERRGIDGVAPTWERGVIGGRPRGG
jgi:hypothetical protein